MLGTVFADDALALSGDGISDEIEIDSCRADRRNRVRRPLHLFVALEACHQPREQSVKILGQHHHTVSTGESAVNGAHLDVFGLTRPPLLPPMKPRPWFRSPVLDSGTLLGLRLSVCHPAASGSCDACGCPRGATGCPTVCAPSPLRCAEILRAQIVE